MTLKLPNIVVRTLAGAVFVALLLLGILCNEYLFATIFSIISGLMLYEFYTLMNNEGKVQLSKWLGVFSGISLFLAVYALMFHQIMVIFGIYILLILVLAIRELYLKRENPIHSLAYIMLGQMYIAVPFALTNVLVWSKTGTFESAYLLAVFVFIWVNDTFAYLTGMTFGKHQLFERISPKKSWEGFVGGTIFTIGASVLFYFYSSHTLTLVAWIGFSIVTVAFGTWGDLLESLIKRTLKVKDSGNMIPGHGGILDRMDSSILAIPATVAYFYILNYLLSL